MAPPTDPQSSPDEIDLASLEWSLRQPRSLFSYAMSVLTGMATVAAMFPLFSVVAVPVTRDGRNLGPAIVRELPPAAMMPGGGFGNAIFGTMMIVAIGFVLSVPIGVLAAIYIAEFGPETRTAAAVRFAAKVLTGLPSILAG